MTTLVSFARAKTVADALNRLCIKDKIRRRDTRRPYDWAVVFDDKDNIIYNPALKR